MYLFSRAGKARHIVMYSSANATEVAVARQWNDIYTRTNRAKPYNDFIEMFHQMKKDQPVRPAYRKFVGSRFTSEFLPWKGKKAKGDPTLNVLNKIRCKGATGGTGVNGRTHIRIAQTAILDKRGIKIASPAEADVGQRLQHPDRVRPDGEQRPASEVRRPGGRGPIPIRQIAQDWQDDGVYDRYLHMKYMTISGVYEATSPPSHGNGTANWSGLTHEERRDHRLRPGERMRRRHADWVDHLFGNPPPQRVSGRARALTGGAGRSAAAGCRPSAGVGQARRYRVLSRSLWYSRRVAPGCLPGDSVTSSLETHA